jgi:glycerol uptake facilitator-like aquaporin
MIFLTYMNEDQNGKPSRRKLIIAEMTGTALLLFIGLSSVILMFGEGNPFEELIPNIAMRRALNGFFFGAVGATIAVSQIGKVSGAHVNPIVTTIFLVNGETYRTSSDRLCHCAVYGGGSRMLATFRVG